ncbi:hypothetical protein PS15p_209576 [Mucor circinelloides]
METFVEYSGIDPDLLVFDGNQYNHLRDVLDKRTEILKTSKNLKNVHIPQGDIFSSVERDGSARSEEPEEHALISKDLSKYSSWFAKFGFSLKSFSIMGIIDVDPNVLIPAMIEANPNLVKLALQPFGDTRVSNMPSFTTLLALKPLMEHLFGLGRPLTYDTPFIRQEESGIKLTHASFVFEDVATVFPILHSVLFCGKINGGTLHVGSELRLGFTAGLFLKAPEIMQIAARRRNREVENLVNLMWEKGGSYKADADVEANWTRWIDFNDFDPRKKAKASSIRDLVRFCWNRCKVPIIVEDEDSAAIAFGLAQVGLCRIEMLDMGPIGGVRVFGRKEPQLEALRLEPSMIMRSYKTYSFSQRRRVLDMCRVPIESEEILMAWLDQQVAETHFLGIENGDPPGTVVMTPEFTVLAETGLMKCLDKEIQDIAFAVSQRCISCEGGCVSKIFNTEALKHETHACATVLFLNTIVTIYIGGVLLKGGMEIDQCTFCSDLDTTRNALKRLDYASVMGVESLLASWFILRTGNSAPHVDTGPVLGIEMEGKVHGLRYAIQPNSVGSPLVSFHAHILEGRHSCACLVFEECYQSNDVMMEEAQTKIVLEQEPDISVQQILLIHSNASYIAVETCLLFPGGYSLAVALGQIDNYKSNQHLCTDIPDSLLATPLNLSECTNGNSSIDIQKAGLRYVLYTYGNEKIQSWVCGLFPPENVCFQGRRSLGHCLALLKEGDILIQGWSDQSNATATDEELPTTVARLAIQ